MKKNAENIVMYGTFKVIFKILNILDLALDKKDYDLSNELSAAHLEITENRRINYLAMLQEAGYIDGARISENIDGTFDVDISKICITLEGLQYLAENSLMAKAAKALEALGLKVAEAAVGTAVASAR